MKKREPALLDLATLQQLWDVVGSSLGEAVREELLYTQGAAMLDTRGAEV